MKVCIVAPRFGKEITGGAEKLIYNITEVLPKEWNIEVHTTCAKDYKTWKNEYKPGKYTETHYTLYRYKTNFPRKLSQFNRYTDVLRKKFPNQSLEEEWEWFVRQGPYSSSLNAFLESSLGRYDLCIFTSYLYLPTIIGLKNSRTKTILIPTLHDEFPAYFHTYQSLFTEEWIYFFNSPEEFELFEKIYGFKPKKFLFVGTYVPFPQSLPKNTTLPYFLTIGRMDAGKGYRELVEFFSKWKRKWDYPVDLYLIGSNPPRSPKGLTGIHFLGYVSEERKQEYLSQSLALINPSPLESFSIVLMESWAYARPVLVNAHSSVMVGHCKRSSGGLYYRDYPSFEILLNLLYQNEGLRNRLGLNGREYVRKNFTKEVIQSKINQFLMNL